MSTGMENHLTFPRQPTVGDVGAVHEAIFAQQKEIDYLDGEIEALMRNIRRLTHQKSQHQTRIRHFKGLITLATRIPSELLAVVFEHAASDWARAPLIVSHVCSAWRAAATLPGVWSHIYVNCDSKDPSGRTQFWLSKAQKAPLYITLEVAADSLHLESVMDLLLKHTHQWRSFAINTLFSHQANYVLSRCGKFTPDLRRVDIRTDLERRDADEIEDQLIGFREAFNNAPLLSTIHLSRELSPTSILLPEKITSLYLHLPSWSGPATLSANSIVQLLRSLPHLKQFTVEFPTYHERTLADRPHNELPMTIVPGLESLTLVLSPDAYEILPYIQAPALRCLTLRSSSEPTGYAHATTGASLVQFIEQSSPPLELIDLHDVDIPPDDLIRCLAALPTLKELRLHESEIGDDMIQMISGPVGACPRLTKLDLRWCGLITGRALVELVQNRGGHPEGMADPIEEVAVMNCSFVKENDIMELARLATCRVVLRPHKDVCRQLYSTNCPTYITDDVILCVGTKGCCNNDRYRQRLRLRHIINLSTEQRTGFNLII